MRINMSNVRPMGITYPIPRGSWPSREAGAMRGANAPRVRYSAAYPTDAPALQASGCLSEANPKGRKGPRESVCCGGKRKLLWQFTVVIKCDPLPHKRAQLQSDFLCGRMKDYLPYKE